MAFGYRTSTNHFIQRAKASNAHAHLELGCTLWGQVQAAGGDCALMRWVGHGAGLPLLKLKAGVADELKEIGGADENLTANGLVGIFRFSCDPAERRLALAVLERRGLVEAL